MADGKTESGRVDFYILAEPGQTGRMRFACKIVEKAYRMDMTVHAVVDDPADAEQFDRLLWTFRQGSFIPHEIVSSGEPRAPVTIDLATRKSQPADVLVNLGSEFCDDAGQYSRIAEIVGGAPDQVTAGRSRYRAYREQGFTINAHEMG